jgi:hypothetical protein
MLRALIAASVAGLLAVLAAAALDERERAFTVGLPPVRVAAELAPGDRACRANIDVPAAFSRVRLATASFRQTGPALTVTAGSARGTVPAGYPDNSTVEVRLGEVAEGGRIDVCVTNEGDHRVALYGSPPDTPPDSLGDPNLAPELGVTFVREEPKSMLALVPEAFDRAALFRPAWVGAWTFWVLLGVVAAAVPALLVAAYRSAVTDSISDPASAGSPPRSTASPRS